MLRRWLPSVAFGLALLDGAGLARAQSAPAPAPDGAATTDPASSPATSGDAPATTASGVSVASTVTLGGKDAGNMSARSSIQVMWQGSAAMAWTMAALSVSPGRVRIKPRSILTLLNGKRRR